LKYRRFGSLGWESSILGFGTARLPLSESVPTHIASKASIEMIRYAINSGINYLDLGYPYDMSRQEWVAGIIREALLDGYRERIKVAVTLPSHLLHSTADFDLYLDRQLNWLQTGRTSFCLFGRLNRYNWPILQKLGAQSWAQAAIADGRIDAIGFSFHDHFQALRNVLSAYDGWSLCQFQFSYMDIDHDPGIGGIKYAANKGLAVVVTEPLRSGRLAKEPPDPVGKIWGGLLEGFNLAEWGMRFVWNYPEVTTAIRDFCSIHEVAENADIAHRTESNSLSVQDELLINNVRDEYRKLGRIRCSSCRPCMPCPEGIDVPRIFELYNDAFIYEDIETARSLYRSELHRADRCNRCMDCEKRCTRKLDIVVRLEQAHKLLADSK
jgi:predicted aldo/keto reductase-like oxidoreductase